LKYNILLIAGVVASFFFCENNSATRVNTNHNSGIEGTYLMSNYCIAGLTVPSARSISMDSLLSIASCNSRYVLNCDTETGNAKCCLSMSTLIITTDTIVRYGYHCPGDNSGSTRISYGYMYKDGKLTGDSLSGIIKAAQGEKNMTTFLTKHNDESITITQLGKYITPTSDSTYYLLYKSDFIKSEKSCFNYNDEPTCTDNYGPWFPIPIW
jgi:hypothetical protein